MASLWQIMVVVMAFLVVPWILTVIKYHLSLNGDEEDSISGGRPVKTEFQLNKFEVASRAITSNPYNITSVILSHALPQIFKNSLTYFYDL